VEKIDGYLADREFVGTEFVRYLIKNEIKPRIRIKHNTRVARRWNGAVPARNFFRNLARGEVIQLRGQRVVWGQRLSVTGTRLMSGESLIILSLDASRVTAIPDDDKRRWEIKTLFKALKNQGFDFAASHLTELDRIEMLLALLAITFCRAHLLGEWLHEQKPIPTKSHHRPATSIFRYGLDWLREISFNMAEKLEAFYQTVALFEELRRSNYSFDFIGKFMSCTVVPSTGFGIWSSSLQILPVPPVGAAHSSPHPTPC